MVSPLFLSDGSSLDGWTLGAKGAVIDGIIGSPPPSIFVQPGGYAFRQLLTLAPPNFFQFDVYIPSSGTSLCNVYFMTSSAGSGGMFLRLDSRSNAGDFSALGTAISWTSWPLSTAGTKLSLQGGSFPTGRFARVNIETRQTPGPMVQIRVDSQIVLPWQPFTPGGDYIGIHGDSTLTTGGRFDNMFVGRPARVAGSAKLSDGTPALKIRVRDWVTATHVAEAVPASDGTFSIEVPAGSFEVTAIGPTGYQPVTHGPVDSVEYIP